MAKYIDAEKLKAEIERLKDETPIGICEYDKGEENGRMEWRIRFKLTPSIRTYLKTAYETGR